MRMRQLFVWPSTVQETLQVTIVVHASIHRRNFVGTFQNVGRYIEENICFQNALDYSWRCMFNRAGVVTKDRGVGSRSLAALCKQQFTKAGLSLRKIAIILCSQRYHFVHLLLQPWSLSMYVPT
jgi:hypothetical protein